MPNSFAAFAVAALMSSSPVPSLVQKCAAALSPEQQIDLLASPKKQKDPRRRYVAIDLKCPLPAGNGLLELIKKNELGSIFFVQATYKDQEIQTLTIDGAASGRGFTRQVDLKRGAYPSRALKKFFVRAEKALDSLNERVCEGDAKARADYFARLKENRRGLDELPAPARK